MKRLILASLLAIAPFTWALDQNGTQQLNAIQQRWAVIRYNLPEAEREEVLRFNIPRLHHLGFVDEITMRAGIKECQELQYARSKGQGIFPNIAGLAVPVHDPNGVTVAALDSGIAPSPDLNAVFGVAFAYVLVRHDFPGRSLVNGLVDLPFAVSPVISGMVFILLFGRQGLLGGIQLMAIGIIGEYLARVYDEVKRRPLYLVESKVNFDDGDTP